MHIRPGNAQHIGSRNEQQDSFAFSHIEDVSLVKRSGVLAVLADGMGGLAMGKEASECVVKTTMALHESSQQETSPIDILQQAVASANQNVLTMARNAGVEGEAGSTLVAAIVKDQQLYWTSVGDSRIYLNRSGELVQLTMDQNYGSELLQRVADGKMTMEEAQSNPDRAALINYIGNQDIRAADRNLRPFPISDGDWIILCSDGLFGTLTDNEIRHDLFGDPNDSCERLIQKIVGRKKPHQDNTSVLILACGDRDPVTVRSIKAPVSDEIVTAEPQHKKLRNKSILVGSFLTLTVILAVAATTYLWPRYGNYWMTMANKLVEYVKKPVASEHKASMPKQETRTQDEKASK